MVIVPEEVEPSAQAAPDARKAPTAPKPPAHGFNVIKDERFTARSMTVEDAVMQLNLLGDELLVFTDAGSGRTSVLYRRKDGNYGLIETASAGAAAAASNAGGR
jgi:putative sigma-54 modulation protein